MTNKAREVLNKFAAIPSVLPQFKTIVEDAAKTLKIPKEIEGSFAAARAASMPQDPLKITGASSTLRGIGGQPRNEMKASADISHHFPGPGPRPQHESGITVKEVRTRAQSGEPARPKFAALRQLLPMKPTSTLMPVLPPNPPAILRNIANSTKLAGVVDRTVKEIAELQYGYRFMRNPYAEANDSMRSRNWINYEGPGGTKMAADIHGGLAEQHGKKSADFDKQELEWGIEIEKEHTPDMNIRRQIAMDHLTEDPEYYTKLRAQEHDHEDKVKKGKEKGLTEKEANLKTKIEEGLKDETEGHKYWVDTAKMLAVADMKSETRQAEQKAGQETQHHELLERVKAKMTKKASIGDTIIGAMKRNPGKTVAGLTVAGLGLTGANIAMKLHSDKEKKASLIKQAYIRHEGGKYVVYSHSGKHMGTYGSEGEAKHRLQQIEYFKKHGSIESEALFAQARAAKGREGFVPFAKGLLMERAERAKMKLPIGGKGIGPELQKLEQGPVDTLSKGGSLDMNVYQRNRKTLLS